jgi:threonine aldolase
MSDMEQILARCTNILPGHRPEHGPALPMKAVLQELADSLDGTELLDSYGTGDYLASFEAEVAALFGKEAAVFLPSGTLAQQIALRIWCGRRRNFTVAMHPSAHPETAEHGGYRFLQGIQRLQFGAPEFVGNRLLTVKDFEGLGQEPGAVLLELPYRPLGGQLPHWDDLLALRAWACERGIPLHMDGARIWQCRPFYGGTREGPRGYAEIAGLFDSLYVSFYKDLGGLSGSMLLGTAEFIREARVWQTRHGGRLRTQSPTAAAARLGMRRVLPQIDRWVERAREVAAALAACDGVAVNPDPPHVNFFQVLVRGDAEKLNHRHMDLARETGTFLFYSLSATDVPNLARAEVHCWENALRFDLSAIAPFVAKLVQ